MHSSLRHQAPDLTPEVEGRDIKEPCIEADDAWTQDVPLLEGATGSVRALIERSFRKAREQNITRTPFAIRDVCGASKRTFELLIVAGAITSGLDQLQALHLVEEFLTASAEGWRRGEHFCAPIQGFGPETGRLRRPDSFILLIVPGHEHHRASWPKTDNEETTLLWSAISESPLRRASMPGHAVGRGKSVLYGLLAVLVVLAVSGLVVRHLGKTQHPATFDIPLTDASLATWEKTHDWSEWFLRVDSGEVAKIDRAHEKEWMIQEWFKQHPPSNESIDIWKSGDYKHPEKWGTVVNPPQLHFSHCVARVWRYIMARETGRAACSADLNPQHVLHCMEEIIFQYAFPPAGGDFCHTASLMSTTLKWHTRFCFD